MTVAQSAASSPSTRAVLWSLFGLALALLLVGIVSRTFLRHVIQVLPILGPAALVVRYRAIEIALTFVMAGCCLFGIVRSISLGKRVRPLVRVAAFALFAGLQLAAMWLSFLGPIANR